MFIHFSTPALGERQELNHCITLPSNFLTWILVSQPHFLFNLSILLFSPSIDSLCTSFSTFSFFNLCFALLFSLLLFCPLFPTPSWSSSSLLHHKLDDWMIHPSAPRLLQSLFLCTVCLSSAAIDTYPVSALSLQMPVLEKKQQPKNKASHCPVITVLQIFYGRFKYNQEWLQCHLLDLVECADITFHPGGYPHPPLKTIHVYDTLIHVSISCRSAPHLA